MFSTGKSGAGILFAMQFSTPIEQIKRVLPAYQKRLRRMGIRTVKDLLFYFPNRYDDFSKIIPIKDIKPNETAAVQGKILDIANARTWKKRMWLTHAIIEDESGAIKIIWFNQPYLTKNLKKGDIVNLAGKATFSDGSLAISNPAYEKLQAENYPSSAPSSMQNFGGHSKASEGKQLQTTIHTGRLVPVYPETEGISSRWLRYIIKLLLPLAENLTDELPRDLRTRQNIPEIRFALKNIHFPHSQKAADASRRRFAFEEIFLIQLKTQLERFKLSKEKAPQIPVCLDKIKQFVESLPFKLTDAQRKSAWEILRDLQKPMPMNRLLEGDVGSGKTVVAAIAALNTVKANYQSAFMAPTEILAQQHFKEISRLFQPFKISIALLTGKQDRINSKKLPGEFIEISRQKILEKAANGELDVLIGTHALIQDKVKFGKLGLVIVDEQHRFGVEQRAKLLHNANRIPHSAYRRQLTADNLSHSAFRIPQSAVRSQQSAVSGKRPAECGQRSATVLPHFLSMTATPIPRTLALTIYGDLDLSLINEMPRGRKKIITKIVATAGRKQTYEFIREEIKKGRQAFVICPLIEESEKLQVKAATKEFEKLSKEIFPDLKLGLLHGKMKVKEKEKAMKEFKARKFDILVATPVVEVGIDVPNAAVMMIEGADRFGLAQLHQFRGRVGRAEHQSYCFLFSDSTAATTNKRLKALIDCENGFDLAEKDLQIRGPGDFIGKKQWGMADLAMAGLSDISLVKSAKEESILLIRNDHELKHRPLLRERLKQFKDIVHLE